MKNQLAAIAQRRRALLETIAAQRMEVAEISLHWQKPLALADTGLSAVRFIRSHPGLVSGTLAALRSLRGIGVGGLAQKGWRLLYLYPAAVSFGLKYLFSAIRSPGAKELLPSHPEERKTEVCH